MTTWWARWEQHWLDPIAAVRARLLCRGVVLLLAFDAWLLRVPQGSHYGIDGVSVAHWAWLDALQPRPWPGLYVALMLVSGIAALISALAPPRRWVIGLLACLWTYGWAMSLLDAMQHHYFLSLALLAFVCFPIPTKASSERALGWPVRRWRRFPFAGAIRARRRALTLGVALASAAVAGMASSSLDLPGAPAAGLLAMGALGIAAAAYAARGGAWTRRAITASGAAVATMWVVIGISTVRLRYHAGAARDLRLLGRIEEARAAEQKAARYAKGADADAIAPPE
jgi:hypothetical protein